MITKPFLVLPMDYYSGNKNLFYHQLDLIPNWLKVSVSFFHTKIDSIVAKL